MKTCPTCKSNHSDHYSHCPLDGTPLVEASLWTEGSVIRGKYRILSVLGRGGMGEVYKAEHVRFKELFALKVTIRDLMNDPVFVKRFEHEAILTRKLQHPNILRIEDFDQAEDGRPFIAMEYIEGRSLKEVIAREAPMPVARVCSIAKQVASALDAAHRLGMVHRDIKPDNIVLVGGTSVPPVGDHGQDGRATSSSSPDHPIAKILPGAGIMMLTGTGLLLGTIFYMSPEQVLGTDLDGRSDIYSLGVVMYQMLTAELPIKGDTPMQTVTACVQTAPRPLRETRHGAKIPDAVSDLVMQCLEKGQERRPATARAVVDGLERAWA